MREMIYFACPFCGWCRPQSYGRNKDTLELREVRFDKVDPEKVKVLQTRQLTGTRTGEKRGGHITIVDSTYLKELPEELKNQIRNQSQKILKALS